MPHYLIVKDRLKDLIKAENESYRAVVRRIEAVILFRNRLIVSKFPARKIGRIRKRETDERI